MKRCLGFGSARKAHSLNRVSVALPPNSVLIVWIGKKSRRVRQRFEPVSFGGLVGIVTILTRKAGRAVRAALRAAPPVPRRPNQMPTPVPTLRLVIGSCQGPGNAVRRCLSDDSRSFFASDSDADRSPCEAFLATFQLRSFV